MLSSIINFVGFAFSIILSIFLSGNKDWRQISKFYVAVSIPIIQIIAFLCNPPERAGVSIFLIVWFVYIVMPMSAGFWSYFILGKLRFHDNARRRRDSFYNSSWSLIVVALMLAGYSYLGVLLFEGNIPLFIMWELGGIYVCSILNKRLRKMTIALLEALPWVSIPIYVVQCRCLLSLVYAATILVLWVEVSLTRR
ncbi:hypothetical protein [Thermococcus sp. 2319x1]|uniref:hypothetical protein n=1 Tax=Thermococcus sp. 2319x1 TaxID=1674923 RepID=UPI001583A6E5|nr:hypothetical protein [Thermococcus sp. 2319x1]